jgi:hypothetical protein
MVYEFDREWHGDVLIELTAEGMGSTREERRDGRDSRKSSYVFFFSLYTIFIGVPQNYLGLRFPASDIPPQARRLYTINPFRLISNTFYEPCPVLPTINPLTNSPLDMSHATFRAVSPVHIQYMKNIFLEEKGGEKVSILY